MELKDRATAMMALACCDQMEQAIRDGDASAIDGLKQLVQRWASNLDAIDLKSALGCIRARANEILQEARDEQAPD